MIDEFDKNIEEYFKKNENLTGLPSVAYFAQKSFLSPNYFGDLIKHFTGKAPIDHIHDYVILQAKDKLKETNNSISEISYSLGFDYPNYFARFFRKKKPSFHPKYSEINPLSMKATHNLIIYFSHSGNTQRIAELIENNIGADMLVIEAVQPYPEGFQAAVDEMSRQNKGKILPDFKQVNIDPQQYNRIFFGYPVWDSRLPPIVRTFLRDHNFNGCTIIPFNTHKGFGTGKSVNEIKEFAAGAKVKDALSINEKEIESAASIVKTWLKEINK